MHHGLHRRSVRTLRPRVRRALLEALEPRRLLTQVSLWDDQAVPEVSADPDSSALEVGVKFQSDVAGSITGVRFYKDATNTGTHDAHLWAADGTLLASETFSDETESGWQTVVFAEPVEILPGTTYIASYHTEAGHYSTTEYGFSTAGVDSGPLHALADGVDGGNGVYGEGDTASFPTLSYNATNYWVDVVFSPPPPAATAPAAPAELSATAASSSEIDLTWVDTSEDETGFRLERSDDGFTFIPVATLDADATSYIDTGLDPDTQYFYQLFAFNDAGDSEPSNQADAFTLSGDTEPPPPTGGSVVYLSDLPTTYEVNGYGPVERDLSVGGRDEGDGGTLKINGNTYEKGFGVNAYSELDFDLTGGNYTTFESYVGIDDETGGRGSVQFQVLLDNVVVYDSGVITAHTDPQHILLDVTGAQMLTLVAYDGGDGIASDHADWGDAKLYSSDEVPPPPAQPDAPAKLKVTASSSSEIDLTWIDTTENETGFRVERSIDGSVFSTIATLDPDSTYYEDTGLDADTHYYYQVIAFNDAGDSEASNTIDVITDADEPVMTPPAAPDYLAAVAVSPSEIDIGWTDLSDDEAGFRIERSTDGLDFTSIATVDADTSSYVDLGLDAGVHYYYRVVAFNDAGDSDASNIADATTQGATPPPAEGQLTGTPIGTAGSWADGGNDISKAFDGSLDTFFDAPTDVASVGLDLGTPTVIGSIKFAPRAFWSSRMVGGQFEASNDGVTWTTLYTITSAPAQNQLTTIPVTDSTPYQYVRYTSPPDGWGNIAELQFFGPSDTTTPPPATGKLSGTPIGTAGSWADAGNDISKAFDGSLDTFFDAPTDVASVGLDLGAATVIGSIKFAPRAFWSSRMVGGKFEASNDGVTWTTLYTITSAPVQNELTTVAVTDSTPYRYVRYTSPADGWGNIAELEFDGVGDATTPPPTTTGKLTGTPIGTAGSWADAGNDLTKALDGSLDTFFDAPTDVASVGLDLGTPTVIGSIKFAPRAFWSSRMVGGQFQGSVDGVTWTTLYTITSAPVQNELTTVSITDATAYRYVRYLSPADGWGNLAELEFYGLL